jgi:voltage-gated potassium channel
VNPRAQAIQDRLEWPMIAAALLTLPAIFLQDAHAHGLEHEIGVWLGAATWLMFAIEVVAMLCVVDSRWEWVRSHPLDVVIVVLTPPFVFASIPGLRLLRALRLLRLLKLFRLAPTARRMFTPYGLRYVAAVALLLLIVAAEAFSSAEHTSFATGVYWALGTMTTAGSGNVIPRTTESKVVAAIVMVVGIAFFAALTGAIAQQFFAEEEVEIAEQAVEPGDEREELAARVHEMALQLQELEQQLRSSS